MTTPDPAHARPPAAEAGDLDAAARKMHEFSEIRTLTWEQANTSRRHGHWHEVMRERAQAVIDAYAPPPPASEAERVLEGLQAALDEEEAHSSRIGDEQYAAGLRAAVALVEAAHKRLAERDRGRDAQ